MPRRFCTERLDDGTLCAAIYTGDTERCPPHQAAADKRRNARPNTTERGYGTAHQQERARLIAQWTPGDPCAHCGGPMPGPAELLDLAHTGDRTGYRGLAHAGCNRGNR